MSVAQKNIRTHHSMFITNFKNLMIKRFPDVVRNILFCVSFLVPTQKMPRLLTTSASACKRLLRKAELMGIDTVSLEMQEAQVAALVDVRKKWHIPPAFSVEFIAYYLDRNDRLRVMKSGLEELLDANTKLLEEQQLLRLKYDKVSD